MIESTATPKSRSPLGAAFKPLVSIEMFERLSYFAVRTMVPIYLLQADEPGGLHLTASQKGTIYSFWFFFQSILPMVTGGYADRYGFKRTLGFSICMNAVGYALMAFATGYLSFLFAVIVLASGTAFFKPGLQGAMAQNFDKTNASFGWGIFYWTANIGALVAPYVATFVLGNPHTSQAWRNLFLTSAGFALLSLLLLFAFKDVPSGGEKKDNPLAVFMRTIVNVFEPRLVAFLLIMSGFWMMLFQLWDLQPNFISDWVDSTPLATSLHFLPGFLHSLLVETSPSGEVRIPQQILLAFNPFLVLLFVVPVSALAGKMRTLSGMFFGMMAAVCGILVAGMANIALISLCGVAFFSLGEMLTGPKKNEYLGLIAPPGKKGLYLGYANIPAGIGGFVGSKLAGYLYGNYGEKATLALRYLAEKTAAGAGKNWNGTVDTLEKTIGITRTQAMATLQSTLNIDQSQATDLLWNTYHPHLYVWLPFAAIGAISAVALAIFGRMAKNWSDMNA